MQLLDVESTDSLVERAILATSDYVDGRSDEAKKLIRATYKKLFELFGNDRGAMISLIATMNSLAKCVRNNPSATSLNAQDAFEVLYKCMKYQVPVDGDYAYFIPFKGKITFVLGYKGAELIYKRKHPEFCDINVKIITQKQHEMMNMDDKTPFFNHDLPHVEGDEVNVNTAKFIMIKVTFFGLNEPIYETYTAKEILERTNERQRSNSDSWKNNFSAMIIKTAKKKFFMEH
jgi:recombinational DNA repair protein RecT